MNNQFMETIIKNAENLSCDDYINPENGLRYCGKCHTPKQAYFDKEYIFNGFDRYPIMCKCQQEAHDKKKAQQLKAQQEEKIHKLRQQAFKDIPAQNWKFENVPTSPQLEKLKHYVTKWEQMKEKNMGVLLFGNVGTGKSYAAGCVANALIEKFQSVAFVGISDVVNRMQGKYGDEREKYIKSLIRVDLLILDDLGAERSTSFGKEQIFDIINKRILSKKPMIITTNIPLHIMKTTENVNERRIFDRVLENCVPIVFDGENFRRKNADINLKHMAKLIL